MEAYFSGQDPLRGLSGIGWLLEELEQQAVYKYSTGQYTLGRLNKNGQRINIRIDLDRKDGSGSVSFLSGWMVYPNGALKLNTPYGGK